MVAGDRITRRFIGVVVILTTLFFSIGLTWNFWFVEEPLSAKYTDGDLPFVVSTTSVTLKRGDSTYISIVPRHEMTERVHLHIELDDPLLIDTMSSITLHPGSNRAVFIPINSKADTGGRCQMSFTSDSKELKQLEDVKIDIKVVHHIFFGQLSLLIGWTYFLCWSLSYYPQLYENWRRRSVVGLSFDWLSLNMSGHICYCLFNVAMCYNTAIRSEYRSLHPHGVIPVKPNDSFFSLHAVLMNITLVLQCVFLERGEQKLSMPMGSLVAGLWGVVFLGLLAGLAEKFSWLQYLYFLSFIKVMSTPIKLTPQVYLNYIRRSTEGWSIYMVVLDFSGGLLGLMQMFIDAYNYDDWAGTLGNPSKIGLAVLTMSYDVLFMIQHFILYNKSPSVFGQRKRRVTDDYRQKFDEYQAHVSPQKNTTIIKKSAKVYEM